VIVTVGRTGSTLLQGVLNSIDGWCIRGENKGLLLKLYAARQSLISSRLVGMPKHSVSSHPFFGSEFLEPDAFEVDARATFLRQAAVPPGIRTTGFKEIRWRSSDLGGHNLWSYLRFLARVFPGVKFIHLTRDFEQVCASSWWPLYDREELHDEANSLTLLMRNAPVPVFELDFAQLVAVDLAPMFEFLDELFHAERVGELVKVRHN
jgi:hypothetical protein